MNNLHGMVTIYLLSVLVKKVSNGRSRSHEIIIYPLPRRPPPPRPRPNPLGADAGVVN